MFNIHPIGFRDLDALRVIGLSRIPRCADCPRFMALERAVEERFAPILPAPAVPPNCHQQVCRPMIKRYLRPAGATLTELPMVEAAPQRKHA